MMKRRTAIVSLCLSLLACAGVAQERAQPMPLQEMRNKADRVLGLSNVSSRSEIDIVFELVDRLLEAGEQKEAEQYLEQALKHYPWQLRYQLIHAELLAKRGAADQAKEVATLVYTTAEEQELIEKAATMLDKQSSSNFPALSKLPGTNYCIVLVPIQDCESWILLELQKEVSSVLGVPVHIQTAPIKYPKYDRDAYGSAINRLRKNLKGNTTDQTVADAMKACGIGIKQLDNDENVLKVMRQLVLKEQGEKAAELFIAYLEKAKGEMPQWDASKLLSLLEAEVKPHRRDNVAYLGVTPQDMYSGSYNFLFGSANPSGGVMSYRRFTADFNEEIPNKKRLLKRTTMQCLSSIGHIFGVQRCSMPTCARAYPNSLSEHDAKEGTLCASCRSGFDKVFGSKAP